MVDGSRRIGRPQRRWRDEVRELLTVEVEMEVEGEMCVEWGKVVSLMVVGCGVRGWTV